MHFRRATANPCLNQRCHFTLLGFTSANGNTVLCALIFDSKTLDEEEWVLGLVHQFAAWEGEEGDIEGYRGKEKRYPQGPVCVVDEKSSPTYCCVSEIGSITAELLVGMLNHIDNSGLFPCENGPHHDDF